MLLLYTLLFEILAEVLLPYPPDGWWVGIDNKVMK